MAGTGGSTRPPGRHSQLLPEADPAQPEGDPAQPEGRAPDHGVGFPEHRFVRPCTKLNLESGTWLLLHPHPHEWPFIHFCNYLSCICVLPCPFILFFFF